MPSKLQPQPRSEATQAHPPRRQAFPLRTLREELLKKRRSQGTSPAHSPFLSSLEMLTCLTAPRPRQRLRQSQRDLRSQGDRRLHVARHERARNETRRHSFGVERLGRKESKSRPKRVDIFFFPAPSHLPRKWPLKARNKLSVRHSSLFTLTLSYEFIRIDTLGDISFFSSYLLHLLLVVSFLLFVLQLSGYCYYLPFVHCSFQSL